MTSTARLIAFLALVITSAGAVPIWGQCGGIGYAGSTQCDSGLSCVKLNDWYSQCQTAPTAAPPPPPPATTTVVPPPPPATTTGTSTATATDPAASIPAGALTRITNFGTNPTNIGMYVYKPSKVNANPGLLVALHYCGGTAQAYFTGTQFRALADERGYLILYGQAPSSGNCWDVTSTATLTHDAGGDSLGIASAVRYAIANWGVNPEKVFVVGTSSGAMMTNVLAGAYPDVFKGGAIFAGVALGCLSSGPTCTNGHGPYPKLQVWHGTADNVLLYGNFQEQLKQWTNVHGISQTPTATYANTPRQNWTKTVYGTGQVEGYSGQGAGHLLPDTGTEVVAIDFFGL
ncbi:hypothetical protein NLJ89_g8833 [Agrocybe chaxingu]|uniref:CBM1 domain-containing protein n=1 Tax=Agrocybe chaxingu TaxID=84603 RepID=A0A9W8JU55_9AGAR|nr:hypothetical protein NLJ89_g8833 [Agrocybe chaxingu]